MDIGKSVNSLILVIIGFVVLLTILGATANTLIAGARNVSTTSLPFASLFDPSSGVILLVLVAGIIVGLIYAAFKIFHHGK